MQQISEFIDSFGAGYLVVLVIIIIWSGIWKLLALWKAARKNHPIWFIILGVVNTMGILEILYIFLLSEMKQKPRPVAKKSKRKRKR